MNITFQQFAEKIKNSVMNEEEINEKCYSFRYSNKLILISGLFLVFIFLFIIFISTTIYYSCEKKKYEKSPKLVLIA